MRTPTPSGVKNSLIEEAFNCSPVNTNFPRNFRNDFKTGRGGGLTLTILKRPPKLEENRFDFSIPFRLVFSCSLTELAELNEI